MDPSVSVSTGFNFNSIEVPSSTVCDMGRYFHNLSLRKSSFQSKGGEYRLLRVLHYCFLVNYVAMLLHDYMYFILSW